MEKSETGVKKDAKGKKVKKVTFQETPFDSNLKVALNKDEVMIQAEIMARLQQEIAAKEDEASSVNKRYKSEIEALLGSQDRAAGLMRDKFEFRPVRCIRRMDWKTGMVTETRTDTGEVIKSRPMLEAETQMKLTLEEGKKPEEAKPAADGQGEPHAPATDEGQAGAGAPPLEPITEDELNKAIGIIKATHRASTAMIQRRMKIGYTQAARIMDALESHGVIGPAKGSEPREILNVDPAAE